MVKIILQVDVEGLGECIKESVWAIKKGNLYEIQNIPFYAYGVSMGDLVACEVDEGGQLFYSKTVSYSGNETIRLLIFDKSSVAMYLQEIQQLGYGAESDDRGIIAIDLPLDSNKKELIDYLDGIEANDVGSYEESALS